MNNSSSILTNKKILILCGIIIIIIISAGIFLFDKQTTLENQNTQTHRTPDVTLAQRVNNSYNYIEPTNLPNSENGHVNAQITYTPNYIDKWILLDNDLYKLQYPQDWGITRSYAKKMQTLKMLPKNNPKNEAVPSFTVYFTEGNYSPTVEERVKPFVDLGFQKTRSTLANWYVTRLSGTIPANNPNNPLPKTPVQETIIYFANGDITFQIIFNYKGDKYNYDYDLLFNNILSTMVFED